MIDFAHAFMTVLLLDSMVRVHYVLLSSLMTISNTITDAGHLQARSFNLMIVMVYGSSGLEARVNDD